MQTISITGRSLFPTGDIIIIDEANEVYKPQEGEKTIQRYNSAIIATHNASVGRAFAKLLSDSKIISYHLRKK